MLSDENGLRVDTFETGVLANGITSGRIEGNGQIRRVFFTEPTRGKANGGSTLGGYAPEPVLSETALYHTDSFELEMTADGAEIRYTTDGSKPTASSKLYTGPDHDLSKHRDSRRVVPAGPAAVRHCDLYLLV